jgi:hypothetical protein
MTFVDLTDSLERAARNGTKAHIPPDLVRALIQSPAYAILQAERTKELIGTWGDHHPPQEDVSSSAPTGSHIVPSAESGLSAGMTETHVHVAAEALAFAEGNKLIQQTRRRKRANG